MVSAIPAKPAASDTCVKQFASSLKAIFCLVASAARFKGLA